MAYAGEVPWHVLGRKVSNDLTPEQMVKAAGVGWEVHQAPSYATYNNKIIPNDICVAPPSVKPSGKGASPDMVNRRYRDWFNFIHESCTRCIRKQSRMHPLPQNTGMEKYNLGVMRLTMGIQCNLHR